MTRAKRYEGELQRGNQWHALKKAEAFKRIYDARTTELFAAVRNRYGVYISAEYNSEELVYNICMEVKSDNYNDRYNDVLVHVEPANVFPSDHLKTKLILLVG